MFNTKIDIDACTLGSEVNPFNRKNDPKANSEISISLLIKGIELLKILSKSISKNKKNKI